MRQRLHNAIKGAIFGAKVGAVIAIAVLVITLVTSAFIPILRDHMLKQLENPFMAIGGVIAGIAMFAFYGAVTGAIVRIIFPP